MPEKPADLVEKIRKQFDFGPYPRIPLDKSPKEDANQLFIHNLVTPCYLRDQKVVSTDGKLILDAGCGSGYKSLLLAAANPGAHIVGIDFSETSVNLARQRMQYHNLGNTSEFHVLSIEELPSLGLQFDYINCDEVLYLLPDQVAGLAAMRAVLKPEGVIRANLHSALQRSAFFRAQTLFGEMGLLEGNPEEMEMGLVQEIMKALKEGVDLKQRTWRPAYESNNAQEALMSNHMLQGDKGFTIPEMFSYLDAAGLELISMVNWRQWNLLDLFIDPDNLPVFLAMSLPELSLREQLRLFELFHPVHRLLDFWCGHPQPSPPQPLASWSATDWEQSVIHLHPQLRTEKVKDKLIDSLQTWQPLDLFPLINATAVQSVFIDPLAGSCLLALMEAPLPFPVLRDRWLQVLPRDPLTLDALNSDPVPAPLRQVLTRLEMFLYVLIDGAGN
uniref:Methyltransferase type 11 n=1 Tax=Cyanothece sp. (strain PCC 7425 / ATCC 29141) TaxID=395961 RepID=B8HTD8_CYAP4